jgi:hypothetical protein
MATVNSTAAIVKENNYFVECVCFMFSDHWFLHHYYIALIP